MQAAESHNCSVHMSTEEPAFVLANQISCFACMALAADCMHLADMPFMAALCSSALELMSALGKEDVARHVSHAASTTACCIGARHVSAPFMQLFQTEACNLASVAGEKLWRLPMEDSYLENLKSPIADLKNTGIANRFGGAITASLFLREFVNTDKVRGAASHRIALHCTAPGDRMRPVLCGRLTCTCSSSLGSPCRVTLRQHLLLKHACLHRVPAGIGCAQSIEANMC